VSDLTSVIPLEPPELAKVMVLVELLAVIVIPVPVENVIVSFSARVVVVLPTATRIVPVDKLVKFASASA
jgi:hypothetical protein